MNITLSRVRVAVTVLAMAVPQSGFARPQQQEITLSAFTTGANWPLYIAKEAGYYEKYGLKVRLAFGIQPAPMAMLISDEAKVTISTLDQALLASAKDPSLVAIGTLCKKSLYALIVPRNVANVRDLKGKRIGVSQLSDSSYTYAVKILQSYGLSPREIEWVVIGTNARAAALTSGRVDATMLTAPTYFRLEEAGYKSLANISDFENIYTPTVNLVKRTSVIANPTLPEQLTKAHAEAIKRFYEDKAFAVQAYLAYDKQEPADIERLYDLYAKSNSFERIPYVPTMAVRYTINNQADLSISRQLKTFDFRTVFDNTTIDRMVRGHFFENLFGPSIKSEQELRQREAFR